MELPWWRVIANRDDISWQRSSDGALEIRKRRLQLVDGIERTQPDVTRRLQCLQQRRDAGLSQLIRVLRELLNLLGLRDDLVPVAEEQLALRQRALRRCADVTANAQEGCLTLRQQLVERRLFDEHPGAVRREEWKRHGRTGAPAVVEFRFGAVRQSERWREVGNAQLVISSGCPG